MLFELVEVEVETVLASLMLALLALQLVWGWTLEVNEVSTIAAVGFVAANVLKRGEDFFRGCCS